MSLKGTLTLAVNTTDTAVSTSMTVGGSTVTIDLPTGPYLRFEGAGLDLSVLGQSITGDFWFERCVSTDTVPAPRIKIAATNVRLSIGSVLTLDHGTLLVALTPTGLVGRIGGTVALTIPQVTLGGTLAVEVNTTPGDATAEFLSGGVTTSLHMPTGHTLQIVGTGLSLFVLGQTLQGDLTLTRTTDAAGRTSVHVVGHNLVLQLGGAGAAAATVTQTGDADLTVSPDGLVGTVRVAVSLAAPGLSLGTPTVATSRSPSTPARPPR